MISWHLLRTCIPVTFPLGESITSSGFLLSFCWWLNGVVFSSASWVMGWYAANGLLWQQLSRLACIICFMHVSRYFKMIFWNKWEIFLIQMHRCCNSYSDDTKLCLYIRNDLIFYYKGSQLYWMTGGPWDSLAKVIEGPERGLEGPERGLESPKQQN